MHSTKLTKQQLEPAYRQGLKDACTLIHEQICGLGLDSRLMRCAGNPRTEELMSYGARCLADVSTLVHALLQHSKRVSEALAGNDTDRFAAQRFLLDVPHEKTATANKMPEDYYGENSGLY